MLARGLPRVVIAGQTPPPHNGQNQMIARIVVEFARAPDFHSEHLLFHFTPIASEMRRGSLKKIVELIRVLARLLAMRSRGPIDLLIFPSGGPQNVPLIRDILLLPWVLLCSRRTVVQFHAAGIASRQVGKCDFLFRLVAAFYRRCDGAVVMTEFNRCDPLALGIQQIDIIPHKLPDQFVPALVAKTPDRIRILYVGHLSQEKGTPQLLRAFRKVAERHPDATLELAGEPMLPLTEEKIREMIREMGLEDRIVWNGVLLGTAKQMAFGRASIFVFPTIAPFESFGLVLVEAMMWGLPIVATDWRGNRDVLGSSFEGICHPVAPELISRVAEALNQSIEELRNDASWGARNRQHFLENYCYETARNDYAKYARKWLALAT